jgi:hypothetical protein
VQIEALKGARRFDLHLHLPAPGWIESVAQQTGADPRPHPVDHRKEDAVDEVERGRVDVMGAPLQHQLRRCVGKHQRREDGLEHEAGAAGGADRKMIVARLYTRRREAQFAAADGKLGAVRAADGARCLDRRDVLAHQPRPRAVGTDVLDTKRLPGHQGQRESGAQ